MTTHPNPALISRYAHGDDAVDDATVWAVEAHLESCPACRDLLATAVDPGTRQLLDRVAEQVSAGIETGPAPVPARRLRRTGIAGRLLPWLGAVAVLMLAAVAAEKSIQEMDSLVLLIAPVAPLLPVAAAWSRRVDPAWELMACVPRGGLWLLLRRTLGVLAVVVPALAVAGWWTGNSPVLSLLPGLAFTAGSLALGGLIGVDRAALGLTVVWAGAVVAPSLYEERLPAVLEAGAWPGWAAATVMLTIVVLARATRGTEHS